MIDLLGVTFLVIFDIPFRCGCPWAGLWGVVILGMTFRPTTVGMVHTAGGDTAFTAESTSEKEKRKISVIKYKCSSIVTKKKRRYLLAPMTGIDSPWAGGTVSGFSTTTAAGSALFLLKVLKYHH